MAKFTIIGITDGYFQDDLDMTLHILPYPDGWTYHNNIDIDKMARTGNY
jgi:hypothetical protein